MESNTRFIWTIATVVALLFAIGVVIAGCERVGAGYVGVKINYAGDDRGVSDIPAVTGWAFYNPFTQTVFSYPIFVQTAMWTRSEERGSESNEEVTFNSKEGMLVSADVSLSYQLVADKVPAFYVKFRTDRLETFTHGFLRNVARDFFNEVAGHYSVEDIIATKKELILADVRNKLNKFLEPYGIIIEQFGFIGAPRAPEPVVAALNRKVTATQDAQRVENELREARAQAEKAIAIARGEAESNRVLSASINSQLLEWRRLQITEQAVAKWNGARPQVEGVNSGGLLLQIQK